MIRAIVSASLTFRGLVHCLGHSRLPLRGREAIGHDPGYRARSPNVTREGGRRHDPLDR